MGARAEVVLVAGGGYCGTGFLVDAPNGDVVLVATLHTFVEIKPEPLVFPESITCTYSEAEGATWTEVVNWAPLNPTPNLLEDWVVLRVRDFRSTKRWRLAAALERQIDSKRSEWSTHGFPANFDEGLGAGGSVTAVGGLTPAYTTSGLPGQVPVIQLLVDQMHGQQVPAVGFSGGPIVVGDRVVGVFRSFPPRGDEGLDATLAAGATVFAIPVQRIAAALGWPVPQPWTRVDQQAQELLDLKRTTRNRKNSRLVDAPSELLRAEAQTLDFDPTGRDANLEQLEVFVEGSVPYHVFAAPGGSGKTRLLIEFCERMRARGWIAGFVPNSMPAYDPETWVRRLCAGQVPRLLVFDYVETAPLPAAKVIAMAASLPTRIRIVLLSRDKLIGHGPSWWERLVSTSGVPRHDKAWTELPPMYTDSAARMRSFDTAVCAFYGTPPDPPADLEHELLARPLYLQSLALLCALGEPPDLGKMDEFGILREILRHERAAWTRWYEAHSTKHMPMEFHAAADAIVAVATLLGECPHGVGHDLARVALDELQHDEIRNAAKCIRDVYGKASLRPMEPDPLGEELVYDTLERGDIQSWLGIVADPQRKLAQLARALVVLARLAQNRPLAREWLRQLLREHGVAFISRVAAGPGVLGKVEDSPGMALANAARMVLDLELATAFAGAMPDHTVELKELAVLSLEVIIKEGRAIGVSEHVLGRALNDLGLRLSELGRREDALGATEQAVKVGRGLAQPDFLLATALTNLGFQLNELGRREDALAATIEAVEVSRGLATAQPDDFLSDLAAALINHGAVLSDLGRREDSLATIREAVVIYGDLAKVRPKAFLPNFVSSLNSLSVALVRLGWKESAVGAIEAAVQLSRELAQARPDAFSPDLAAVLNNLGSILSEVGRREDALAVTMESVQMRRELAQARPNAFLPDLAMALNNLSNRMNEVGRLEDALAASIEAVQIRRELAQVQPDAFLPDLAAALNNLGRHLCGVGRRETALAASVEAASIFRELARTQPDTFLSDFAGALNNLSATLNDAGKRGDALAASMEAVSVYRDLAGAHPEVFLPDLAKSLNNLGLHLSEMSKQEEAVAATDEAVELNRELARARPEASLPELAASLTNLSGALRELGRPEDALAAADEAVTLYRELVKAQSDTFFPYLVAALVNLGAALGNLDRPEDAVAITEEAASSYRSLANAQPDAYLPHLAATLINLGAELGKLGRLEDALAAAEEAASSYRGLAEAQPDAFLPYLAVALTNLGTTLRKLARPEDAIAAFAEGLRRLVPLFIQTPPAFAQSIKHLVAELVAACRSASLDIPEDLKPIVEAAGASLPPLK